MKLRSNGWDALAGRLVGIGRGELVEKLVCLGEVSPAGCGVDPKDERFHAYLDELAGDLGPAEIVFGLVRETSELLKSTALEEAVRDDEERTNTMRGRLVTFETCIERHRRVEVATPSMSHDEIRSYLGIVEVCGLDESLKLPLGLPSRFNSGDNGGYGQESGSGCDEPVLAENPHCWELLDPNPAENRIVGLDDQAKGYDDLGESAEFVG